MFIVQASKSTERKKEQCVVDFLTHIPVLTKVRSEWEGGRERGKSKQASEQDTACIAHGMSFNTASM